MFELATFLANVPCRFRKLTKADTSSSGPDMVPTIRKNISVDELTLVVTGQQQVLEFDALWQATSIVGGIMFLICL